MTVTRIIQGIEDIISTIRIKIISIIPPQYPEIVPTVTPIKTLASMASTPTNKDTRPP